MNEYFGFILIIAVLFALMALEFYQHSNISKLESQERSRLVSKLLDVMEENRRLKERLLEYIEEEENEEHNEQEHI